ncbi:MAG: glycosyltransferase family 2 protein [Bacteroidota bacterium]|nr:glycosyltransferase family 2 protein [Bacteroidota bacterium]
MVTVSVWITTYNHEQYIAEALESVLMQQTNFEYEIILGEDFSTDNTRQIVVEFKKKYPFKIKLLLPEQNLGMIELFKRTYEMCNGKYIAWLDGDDFWTDPLKLQKQVNFLEANPKFVFCFHKASILNEFTGKTIYFKEPVLKDDILTIEDVFHDHCSIRTPTVLVKNILPKNLPDWIYSLPFTDRAFYYLLLEKGNAKYFPENMATYRKHKGGAWSGTDKSIQLTALIKFYQTLHANFNRSYRSLIKTKLKKLFWKKINHNIKKGKYWLGIKEFTNFLIQYYTPSIK